MSHVPVLIPIVLLLTAFAIPLAGLRRKELAYPVAVTGAGLSFLFSAIGLWRVLTRGSERYQMGGWAPPVGIEFVLDPLSAFMAVVVTFIGLLVLIYSRRSILDEVAGKRVYVYALALMLLTGLTGMALTGDLFNLYVFLEIASLSTYALIAVGDKRAPLAAFRYLILGSVGGGFYFLGVGFIYFASGSLNMADVAARLPELYESRALIAAATLMVLGLGLKMALFPLHVWLPNAYTHAPSAVTALIAPISTKIAAYALIRLFLDVFGPEYLSQVIPVTSTIGWLAAAGVVFASVMAIAQKDFRRMLAYSSVGQIAFVGMGIGLANPLGLIGALLHILNHAVMKACLFMVGGSIRLRTNRSQVTSFKGLGRQMRWTMLAFTVAALSMIGVPPTAGFFSKWYLVLGSIEAANWVFVAIITASSLLTAVYFFRVLEVVYADPSSEDKERVASMTRADAPLSMLVPTLVLAAGVVILGLMNVPIVTHILERVVAPLG